MLAVVASSADDKWPADYKPGIIVPGSGDEGGENIATAVVIPGTPFTDTGFTCDNIHEYDEVCPYSGSMAPDVVYSFTPCADGMLTLDCCLGITDYDTKLFVYQDTWTPGAPYACNDDFCSAPYYPYSYVSYLSFPVMTGHTYYIVVDAYGSDCGNYTLDVTGSFPSPANSPTWGSIKALFE
jgi:hypothetical protein